MKIIYIVAPYRADSDYEIGNNIAAARELSAKVWRCGAAALCPQLNSAFMSGCVQEHVFLDGYEEMVRRCDAVVHGRAPMSSGCRAELKIARTLALPIFNIEIAAELRHFTNWLKREG